MGGEEGRRGGGYGCNPFQIPEFASWCVGMTWDCDDSRSFNRSFSVQISEGTFLLRAH